MFLVEGNHECSWWDPRGPVSPLCSSSPHGVLCNSHGPVSPSSSPLAPPSLPACCSTSPRSLTLLPPPEKPSCASWSSAGSQRLWSQRDGSPSEAGLRFSKTPPRLLTGSLLWPHPQGSMAGGEGEAACSLTSQRAQRGHDSRFSRSFCPLRSSPWASSAGFLPTGSLGLREHS